jgi:hypothetical protein
MSTPTRVSSPAGVSSETRDLLALHAPMTGGSFKETKNNARQYKPLAEMHLDENSNGSLHRELKRSRTKLTVIGPPVVVEQMVDADGHPEEPRFVQGSIKMLQVLGA